MVVKKIDGEIKKKSKRRPITASNIASPLLKTIDSINKDSLETSDLSSMKLTDKTTKRAQTRKPRQCDKKFLKTISFKV